MADNKVKVVLNREGVRELLKSEEMMAVCSEHASQIMERCGAGYEMDAYVGKNRVNAMVTASSYQAKADNMKNNTLLKAVKG